MTFRVVCPNSAARERYAVRIPPIARLPTIDAEKRAKPNMMIIMMMPPIERVPKIDAEKRDKPNMMMMIKILYTVVVTVTTVSVQYCTVYPFVYTACN